MKPFQKQIEDLSNQIKSIENSLKKLSINPIKISNEPESVIPVLSFEPSDLKSVISDISKLNQEIKELESVWRN